MNITWETIRKNWAIIIVVLTWLFYSVLFFATINGRVFDSLQQKYEVVKHSYDKNIHTTYAENVTKFTTRPEYEAFKSDTNRQLQDIKDDLKEMKRDIKKLLERK